LSGYRCLLPLGAGEGGGSSLGGSLCRAVVAVSGDAAVWFGREVWVPVSDDDDLRASGDGDPARSGATRDLAGVVAHLRAAVELVGSLAAGPLDGAEVGAVLVEARAVLQQLEGGLGRLGRRFEFSGAWQEDGDKNAKCWLARRTRRAKRDEERLLQLGEDLAVWPNLAAALDAGEVHVGHVELLAGLANSDRYGEAYRLTEDLLLEQARTMYWAEFCQYIREWKLRADEDGAERDAASDAAARYLRITPGLRSTGLVDGELTATARETISNSLERIEDELFRSDWDEAKERLGRDPGLHELGRTKAQRLHDALEEMAVRAHTVPKGAKRPEPLLSIHLGLDMLAKACELDSGEPLTPGQVAPLLNRALIERIVWDGPARILEIGEKRTFTGALRRAIHARDRTCRFPGCDTPGKWCDVDHHQPWSRDGKTIQANGGYGCGHHNHLKADTPPDQLAWDWEPRRWVLPHIPQQDDGDTRTDNRGDDPGHDPPLADTG
jgi:hypothetical protein